MAVLGIDFGTKYIGLALYLPDKDMIMPIKGLRVYKTLFTDLAKVIKDYNVNKIVLGLIADSDVHKETLRFRKQLQSYFDLPVVIVDESLTTQGIKDSLRLQGKTHKQLKNIKSNGIMDSLSATKILERAIEANLIS